MGNYLFRIKDPQSGLYVSNLQVTGLEYITFTENSSLVFSTEESLSKVLHSISHIRANIVTDPHFSRYFPYLETVRFDLKKQKMTPDELLDFLKNLEIEIIDVSARACKLENHEIYNKINGLLHTHSVYDSFARIISVNVLHDRSKGKRETKKIVSDTKRFITELPFENPFFVTIHGGEARTLIGQLDKTLGMNLNRDYYLKTGQFDHYNCFGFRDRATVDLIKLSGLLEGKNARFFSKSDVINLIDQLVFE